MTSSDWTQRVGAAAREVVCSALAVNESLAGVSDALFGVEWSKPLAGGLRRGFCGDPNIPPSPDDFVPFEGGQCVGVNYAVSITRYDQPGGPLTLEYGATGPIGGLQAVLQPVSTCEDLTRYDLVGNPGSTGVGFDRFTAGNQCIPVPPPTINSVRRVDNQPDNCGNPPPKTPTFSPITINKSVTYTTNLGDEITEDYDFTLSVPVIIGGIVIAPVTIAGNDFTVELGVDINGDIKFEFGSGNRDGMSTDGEPPTGDEPPEDAETERRIVGVLITSTINPNLSKASNIAQTFGQDVYVPNLGLVSFVASVTDSAVGWSADIPVKNVRQYIPCPFPQGAIAISVNPQTGVTMDATKVYKALTAYSLSG